MARRSIRPKHSTVVAYLALSVALGGTGYAATALPRNSVTSATVRNGSIKLQDLAPSVRPEKSNARFRSAVVETVTDPASGVVNIRVSGEKGDKGDPGATITGPIGSAGATGSTGATGATGAEGSSGPQGLPGAIRAYGHIRPDGSGSVQGATVTHPGLGVYCVNGVASGITAIVANPDAINSTAHVVEPNQAATNPCRADQFLVQITNQNGVDVGAWIVGS